MNVYSNGYSQKVTLTGKQAPLEEFFSTIKQQTGYVFFYDLNLLKTAKPVTLKIVDTELRKNARVTIFTNSSALNASLNKVSSGYGKKEKEEISNISNKIFANEETIKTNQKFCNIREDMKPFRYTIADCYPDFVLGSDPFNNLIKKIPNEKDNKQDNPYLKELLNKKKFNF
jgi:hypothetical protein